MVSSITMFTSADKKVELHVHLDGCMRPETILDLARKRGVKLPADNVEDLKPHIQAAANARDLTEVLNAFFIFLPTVVGDLNAIRRVAYEFCEDSAQDGVIYTEPRYSPHFFADEGKLALDDVIKAVNDGLRRGGEEFGIRTRSILCCMRHKPEWSAEVLELAVRFKNEGVVGIDIAGDEILFGCPTPAAHVAVYQDAKRQGIHRTVHAGESGTAANVTEAVEVMHAERVGHGYRAVDDKDVYRRTRELGIHFEMCPSTSLCTNAVPDISEHPAIRLAADGANLSINSDDTCIIGSTLTDEYNKVCTEMGLHKKEVVKTIFNAAQSSFLPEVEKTKLIKELKEYYKELAPEGV